MLPNTPSSTFIKKPYFCLPGTIAKSAIADSCLACFDYTNSLADLVIGYMAAPLENNNDMDQSYQSITIRNHRGKQMVDTALYAGRLQLYGEAKQPKYSNDKQHEGLTLSTLESDSIIMEIIGNRDKIPDTGMPQWLGEIIASVITYMGPKGIPFAKYSIDYHILRNYLYVLHEWGEQRTKLSLPEYAKKIVDHYMKYDNFVSLQEIILSKHPSKKE